MSCKVMHVAAIVSGCVGFIFIIVALSSSAWMQGCIPLNDVFKAVKNLLQSQGQEVPAEFDTQVQLMGGMSMCIKQGLFTVSMSIMNLYDVNLPIDFISLPRYILFTTVGLILGALVLLICVVMLIVAMNRDADAYEQQSKNNRIEHKAMTLAIIAALLCFGGMVTYSVGSSPSVHNPLTFVAEFGNSVSGSISNMMQNQQLGGGLSRGKRDIDLDSTHLDSATKEYINTMFGSMDPVYSYSFIVGWLSVAFAIFVVVLTVLIRMRSSHNNYENPPIKL